MALFGEPDQFDPTTPDGVIISPDGELLEWRHTVETAGSIRPNRTHGYYFEHLNWRYRAGLTG
ncbi:hypothetical protein [Nocardia cyriacigeorgica]|uniref:Uncharacterized protein n=1 Tax=Nocardia cyriacigeorgica TaxID=135487 RepID=A0A4U8W849_9NOCA|nr:hypothetical protein [Nocardia cyriacigeorgica]VFB01486.1 Uncharacterised protein [Nocardia cyriacigeorgica]